VATTILDDGIGDDPDFEAVFCEMCDEAISPGMERSYGVYTVLCDPCLVILHADDSKYEYPPADSDL
jgi:hypothetical protein